MSQSLANITVHIVFSTQKRNPCLESKLSIELYSYMAGVLKRQGCNPYQIGGTRDHIHILCSLSKITPATKIIEQIKTSTSLWIKNKREDMQNFHWQNGYGIFSISSTHVGVVSAYIRNQEKHHNTTSFQDELRKLLGINSLAYDERYLWN